jgi:peptide subunit release factor 1 (eRF1)
MSTPKPTLQPVGQNIAETTSPEELMTRLIEFGPQTAPVLSLYLDGRADAHGRQNFATFVRKRLTERSKTYAPHTPERESFDLDFVRIVGYLEDELRPSAQGVAIFACSGANDFFEVGQFNAPFEHHRLFVSDRPHLYPLARLIDQYRRYAVVLADTNSAHIFVFASGRAVRQKELHNVKTIGDMTQSKYQRHLENYHLHHVKEVVEALERTVREQAIDQIILAGDEETVIPLLREQMTKELSAKVIDVLSLEIDTPEHELLQASLVAYRRYNSLNDMQKVEHLVNEYQANGLAVTGVVDTLAALSNGQVEELLITATAADLRYDEAETRKVLTAYGSLGEPPATLDQRTIADEMVRRAIQLSSARVTFVEDSSGLEKVGGVGALLRYRVSPEHAAPYEETDTASKSEALIET